MSHHQQSPSTSLKHIQLTEQELVKYILKFLVEEYHFMDTGIYIGITMYEIKLLYQIFPESMITVSLPFSAMCQTALTNCMGRF